MYVVTIKETKDVYRIFEGQFSKNKQFVDLEDDWKVALSWILGKEFMKKGDGQNWFKSCSTIRSGKTKF